LQPRNLGLVHVRQGFDAVSDGEANGSSVLGNTLLRNGEPVEVRITDNVVDSVGPSEAATRVDRPTKSFTRRGVTWLTNLPSGVSAERPKLVKIASNRYVAAWEQWTYEGRTLRYQTTKALLVNDQGQIVVGETTLNARLNPSGADRPFAIDGSAGWIAGNASTGTLTLYTVDASLRLTATQLGSDDSPGLDSRDRLNPGDFLGPTDTLESANGQFTLELQSDGNVVLADAGANVLWASGTAGRAPGRASMQSDGNFVIYDSDSRFVWNTGTVTPGSHIVLQDDGRLAIYSPSGSLLWAVNSAP
jgi:hypothetical protein